jgi:hypothetical protein
MKDLYTKILEYFVRRAIKRVGPRLLFETLSDNKFKYFDPNKLEAKYLAGYKKQARDILNMKVWQNEKARYFAECSDYCVRFARNEKEVEGMRWSISALEAFEEHLVSLAGNIQEDSN